MKRLIYIFLFLFIFFKSYTQNEVNIEELRLEAENFIQAGNKNQAANSLYMIAIYYWNIEDYENSIENFEQSLSLYEDLKNQNAIKIIYSHLGQISTDLVNYEKALDYFQKSLTISEELGDNDDIASQLLNIALIKSYQLKYQESNTELIKALELAQQNNNISLIRSCYGTLAENYEKLGDNQKSLEYYNFFLTFEKLLQEQKITDIQEQSKTEIEKANAEKKAKELELAIKKYQLSEVEDSLKFAEYEKQQKELEIEKLEKEKLEQDLEIQEQKTQQLKEKTLRHALSTIFGLILIFAIIMFFQIRQKNKANKLLITQKKEIEGQAEKLEAQNEELEKLSIVASKTKNAVIIADSTGKLEWTNEAFKNILGYDFEEYKSIFGDNLLTTSHNEEISFAFEKCINNKESVSYVSKFLNKFGTQIWTQTTLTPVIYDGEIQKVVAIDSNITEIKIAEEKLKDSILYASKIQMAIIPKINFFKHFLPKSFVMFKPRDVVSGDFYWIEKINNKIIIAAADCTGHGVPGALLSILGISFLSEILKKKTVNSPAQALNLLRDRIKSILLNTEGDEKRREGIDIALCVIDSETKELEYSGAYNPLLIYKNNEIEIIKGDKMPVGTYLKEKEFTNHKIKTNKDERFYIFSDGFLDQFGGEKNDKFKLKRFKNLIIELKNEPIENQLAIFENTFNEWKGNLNQMDDVLVIGFEI